MISRTIPRMIFAFFSTKAKRVSPGCWLAPAVITTISAVRQSSYVPAQISIFCGPNGKPWLKSIASPSALSLFTSIKTNSSNPPWFNIEYAKLIPTNPVPTKATRLTPVFISFTSTTCFYDIHFRMPYFRELRQLHYFYEMQMCLKFIFNYIP